MKYSQAVLVATIGGATLVSAIPTRPKSQGANNGVNKQQSSKLNRVGKGVGNGVRLGSTFALAAGGNPPSANQPLPEEQTTTQSNQQTVKSRELPKKSKGAKLRSGTAKLKQAGQQAVQKAGGPSAVAEGLGNMYNFAQNQGLTSDTTNLRREVASADSTASEPKTPTTPETPAPHRQKKKKGGKKRLSGEEKKAKAEEWKNTSSQTKAELKAKRKGHKKGNQSGSTQPSSHNSESTTPGSTTPPSTPNPASVAARDFDDMDGGLLARELIEELDARGFWSNLKGNYKERKMQSQQQYESPPLVARDLFDEQELELRDFDDYDELEMRGLWKKVKGIFSKGKQSGVSVDPTSMMPPPSQDPNAPQRRDLTEDEELVLRGLEDYDELEMRGLWKKVKGIFSKGKQSGVSVDPTSMMPPPSQDPNAPQRRDLTEDEELVLRGLDDLLDERDLDFDNLEARGLTEDEELMLRDLEDHLDARGLDFNDLEARGKLRNIFGAIKDTFKGKKPGMPTDPSMASDPSLQVRELLEDLEARDIFEELDELD